MSADLATVGVVIDATGAKTGADQAVLAADKVKASFAKMHGELQRTPPALAGAGHAYDKLTKDVVAFEQVQRVAAERTKAILLRFEQDFARSQADIKESLARGLITPEQARAQGAQAGQAFNQGLLGAINKAGATGGFSGAGGQALFVGLANNLKQVDQAAKSMTGLKTVTNQFAQVAAAEIGLRSGLGSLTGSLGSFALGPLMALGVIAGVGGLVLLFKELTKESRAAKEELTKTKDAFAAMVADMHRANAEGLKNEIKALGAEAAETYKKILALRAAADRLAAAPVVPGMGSTGGLLAQADKLEENLTGMVDRVSLVGRILGELTNATSKAGVKDANAARQAAEERLAQVGRLGALEKANALEIATLANDRLAIAAATAALRTHALMEELRGLDRLNDAEKERFRLATEQTNKLEDQKKLMTDLATEAGKLGKALGGNLVAGLDAQFAEIDRKREQRFRRIFVDEPQNQTPEQRQESGDAQARRERDEAQRRADADAKKKQADETERMIAASFQAAGTMVDLTTALLGIDPAAGRALKGLVGVFEAADAFAAATTSGDKVAAVQAGLSAALTIADTVLGMSDAAARAAVEAQERWMELERSIEDFGAVGLTSFDRAARDLAREFDALVRQAADAAGLSSLGKSTDEVVTSARGAVGRPRDRAARDFLAEFERLQPLLEARQAELARQAKQALTAAEDDFHVRELVAQGRAAESEALRRELEDKRELAALQEQFGDLLTAETLERFKNVQALEAEAEALAKATAEAEKRADILADLNLRELRARLALGQQVSADIRQAEKEAELTAALRQGFTETEVAQLRRIQSLEDEALAIGAATAATEKARRLADFGQDLVGRGLAATAITPAELAAAENYRVGLQQEREIREAMTSGIDAAGLAALRVIHGLENEKRLRDSLAAAQRESNELLKMELQLRDDINVRSLRAQGFGGAADEIALANRQKQELADAEAKNLPPGLLADLRKVQKLERDAARNANLARQDDAFSAAASANFSLSSPFFVQSKPELNLAVGAADSTIQRLSGFALSQLGVQQQMLAVLKEIASQGRGGGRMSIDAIDEALGRRAETTDRNFGIQSGGR